MGSMGHTGQECCIGIRRPANGQMLYTGRDGCEILANLISEGQKNDKCMLLNLMADCTRT